jgi:hypothetical protein
MRQPGDERPRTVRRAGTRTEDGTQITLRIEAELMALCAFATTALLCLTERMHELPAAAVAFGAAGLLLTRRR